MEESEFKKLVKKDRYQVFLFSSPIPRPYSFAIHTWLVTNKKGKITRWDSGKFMAKAEKSWGYVHKNIFKDPIQGINKSFKGGKNRFSSKYHGKVEGIKGSIAEKMILFIEKNAKEYPFKDVYKMYPGPNSNTFIQWLLNHFPNSGFKLPRNAFGKNWKGLKKQ